MVQAGGGPVDNSGRIGQHWLDIVANECHSSLSTCIWTIERPPQVARFRFRAMDHWLVRRSQWFLLSQVFSPVVLSRYVPVHRRLIQPARRSINHLLNGRASPPRTRFRRRRSTVERHQHHSRCRQGASTSACQVASASQPLVMALAVPPGIANAAITSNQTGTSDGYLFALDRWHRKGPR